MESVGRSTDSWTPQIQLHATLAACPAPWGSNPGLGPRIKLHHSNLHPLAQPHGPSGLTQSSSLLLHFPLPHSPILFLSPSLNEQGTKWCISILHTWLGTEQGRANLINSCKRRAIFWRAIKENGGFTHSESNLTAKQFHIIADIWTLCSTQCTQNWWFMAAWRK